jgi:hypothetical protein
VCLRSNSVEQRINTENVVVLGYWFPYTPVHTIKPEPHDPSRYPSIPSDVFYCTSSFSFFLHVIRPKICICAVLTSPMLMSPCAYTPRSYNFGNTFIQGQSKLWSSSLCNFLHPSVTRFMLRYLTRDATAVGSLLMKYTTWTRMEEWMYRSTFFWPRN